jgi:hypothetical protein
MTENRQVAWYGNADEPRVIRIWDPEEDVELLNKLNSIATCDELDECIDEHIADFDCEPYIWSPEGILFIDGVEKKFRFTGVPEPDTLRIVCNRYKGEDVCVIFFDSIKAFAYWANWEQQDECPYDQSRLTYENGIISYRGEPLQSEDSRGISSTRVLVKRGEIVPLQGG